MRARRTEIDEEREDSSYHLILSKLDRLSSDVAALKEGWTATQTALGAVIETQEKHGRELASIVRLPPDEATHPRCSSSSASSPTPEGANSNAGIKLRGHEYEYVSRDEASPSMLGADPAVVELLQADKALAQLLQKMTAARQRERGRAGGPGEWADGFVLRPDGRFRTGWNLLLVVLLILTCGVVPLRIAFPQMFDAQRVLWDVIDIFIEWSFVFGVVLNFFTGYVTSDGQLVMRARMIARRYLRGWFIIDAFSSIPVDTFGVLVGDVNPIVRLNKVFRIARLYKGAPSPPHTPCPLPPPARRGSPRAHWWSRVLAAATTRTPILPSRPRRLCLAAC